LSAGGYMIVSLVSKWMIVETLRTEIGVPS
jgi:hypothetical protein